MDKNLISLYPAYAEEEDFNFVGCEKLMKSIESYISFGLFLISSDKEYMSIYLKDSIEHPLEEKMEKLEDLII